MYEQIDDDETIKKVPKGHSQRHLTYSRFLVLGFFLIAIAATVFVVIWFTQRSTVHGAVSTSNAYATEAGMEVLKAGGNAIDAAIAIQAMLTLCEPASSGLGGGFFLMYYNAAERMVYALDAREEAPAANNGTWSSVGGASVAVPGTVAGLKEMKERWGTKDLRTLFQPAIDRARAGYPMTEYTYETIWDIIEDMSKFDSTRAIYFNQTGYPLPVGELIINNDYAKTLETLIEKGLDDFYTGEIAQDLINAIKMDPNYPGDMSLDDLEHYLPVFREPVKTTYKGYEMVGMNMPSSGIVTYGLAMNILESLQFNYTEDGYGSLLHIKTVADALSLAFADRNAYLADADWVDDIPIQGLLDKEYARNRSSLINPQRAVTYAPPGKPKGAPANPNTAEVSEGTHTTSFSVADQFGNIVIMTSTIQEEWGSCYVVPGRGFMLNNELTDFDTTGINRMEAGRRPRRTALFGRNETLGGKRPRSSMSPTIVFKDGVPVFGLGSTGGHTIIASVMETLLNLIDWKMAPQDAVKAPRVFASNTAEWKLEPALMQNEFWRNFTFSDLGITTTTEIIGVDSLISITKGKFLPVSDPRRPTGLSLVQ
eukprot:TRINITY_DN1536_c0_g1_i4.p1 TRINITY_DN1536_c0_g1~~TRINITY_DN1536_c0_g1_i4.p1  ORF type:complete len:596 (+),score=117.63 TRINITY_DN1536_c0_g1_i4:30-1817(+)